MARTAIAISHDDLAAQRAIVEEIRALPFTGARAVLPRIRRPRPARTAPLPQLFAFLPEMRRPPRPWEQAAAIEAALPPAPWSLTPEETAVVEEFVSTSWRDGAAAVAVRQHWDTWITGGRIEIEDRVEAVGETGRIRVRETRLGWNAVVSFDVDRTSVGPGNTLRPDIDDDGRFLWSTREAAITYSAHKIWRMFSEDNASTGRERRKRDKIASRIEAFFCAQGIDATRPPERELKRVLITRARERELRLAAEAAAKAAKAPAVEPDDGTPGETRLGRHLIRIGAIEPPTPLALKRRRLKDERAAAARAAAEAEAAAEPSAPEPEPAPDAMARLVASGISNEYLAGLGALRDPDAPWSPRSIGFPVRLHRVGGPFQPPTAPRIWELHLSTPACGDLPFVRRVEEVTGLKAKWVSTASMGGWHHAVDLSNDEGWERLAASMEHTEAGWVTSAVGMHVLDGSLGTANARRLLLAIGVSEPAARTCPNIRPNPDAGLQMSLGGWEAIHAVEDGLIVPGNPKRNTFARVTDAGWRSVGKEPPTKEALAAARKAARC
ncbi:hypothetical protein LPC10_17440 [Methylorubrum sp. B1-46]|uniref:hypothetical protein n=1 Tax=Methylorubrum TaxID=2282523 RepID=UPI001E5560E2|nr:MULTISPECIES: hypothetical protein [Methylorubrum]MCG5246924.1 hypothetical protein [Methylorubrum extorquens]UGB24717.1 hypothetical protein LPC10_17440 [Methylorubrum sp. B1-46]